MSLALGLLAMLALGILAMGLCYLFLKGCEKIWGDCHDLYRSCLCPVPARVSFHGHDSTGKVLRREKSDTHHLLEFTICF